MCFGLFSMGCLSGAGIAHLMGSVSAELEASNSKVAVHTISPGMVLTGKPLSNSVFLHPGSCHAPHCMQFERVLTSLCCQR